MKRTTKDGEDRKSKSSTVAMQVRFDGDLHQQLKATAETAGISLNQLIQGICRGAIAHLVQGEPDVDDGGFVRTKPQRGCVFFGRAGFVPTDGEEECEECFGKNGVYPDFVEKGTVWFGLDFTNRGYVRYQPK